MAEKLTVHDGHYNILLHRLRKILKRLPSSPSFVAAFALRLAGNARWMKGITHGTEGIGKRIEEAYIKAGGEELRQVIMLKKVKDGSTFLTQIHHRQTPMRILYDQSDAAPVWYTEAYYQKMINHPVDLVEIPQSENIEAHYIAGLMKTAPHPQAAEDFMNFLISPQAKAIYKKYGFLTED